jgi:hypothetical protein
MSDAWREYMALNVQSLAKNTAKAVGGSYIDAKWHDIAHPHVEKPVEDIIADVVAHGGITLKH